MLPGTDNIPQNIPFEIGKYQEILCEILSTPHNIVTDPTNVMLFLVLEGLLFRRLTPFLRRWPVLIVTSLGVAPSGRGVRPQQGVVGVLRELGGRDPDRSHRGKRDEAEEDRVWLQPFGLTAGGAGPLPEGQKGRCPAPTL